MKKIIIAIFTVCMLITSPIYVNAGIADVTVMVNDEPIISDVPAQIIDDRTMLPMRAIFEKLGAEVIWHPEDGGYVSASKGNTVIWVYIGKNEMKKGDKTKGVDFETIYIDVPAQIVSDRTLVPVRAVAEALECIVEWDGDTRTVTISSFEDSSSSGAQKPSATKKPIATEKPSATKKPIATEKPASTNKPNSTSAPKSTITPSSNENMEISYDDALKAVKNHINNMLGSESSDITINGDKSVVTYSGVPSWKFECYSKSLQADGENGYMLTVYVLSDGTITHVKE